MGCDRLLRHATEQDVAAVLRVAEQSPSAPQWTATQYVQMLTPPPNPALLRVILLAEQAGAVNGFAVVSAICFTVPAEAELESIAVLPEQRGTGIGTALLDAAIAWAGLQGADRLRLEVREGNTSALRLYHAKGFVTAGIRSRYYANPTEHALCMQRTLK